MITRVEFNHARERAANLLRQTHIAIRPDELTAMEVADFGLGELEISGAQILTLVNTDQIAAKLLVLFPDQTEPEHMHPRVEDYDCKEETVRCEWGELYMYSPGDPTPNPKGHPPIRSRHTYTVWHEYVMHPGGQITFPPNVLRWFQAGPAGAVIWSFSTRAIDVQDVFTAPDIRRETIVAD